MKVFIVAALLVAAVASQDLDLLRFNKEKSLFKFDRPVYNELMMKQKLGHPLERYVVYGNNVEVPKYLQEYFVDQQVLSLEEIIETPLFREYYTLPYFRQYWSYPVFQKYVASIYFQRFWQIPTFRQYFVDAGLFYKYIYPVVAFFKYDTTTVTPYEQDYVYRNKNVFPFVYGQRDVYPTYYNQDYKYYDQVYKNIFDKIYNHLYTTYERPAVDETVYGDNYYNNRMVVPQIYGEQVQVPHYQYQTVYPQVYKYNPYVARMMYGYTKRFPTTFYNTIETPKMVERMPMFEGKPIMGMKTFDKFEKIIPQIIA